MKEGERSHVGFWKKLPQERNGKKRYLVRIHAGKAGKEAPEHAGNAADPPDPPGTRSVRDPLPTGPTILHRGTLSPIPERMGKTPGTKTGSRDPAPGKTHQNDGPEQVGRADNPRDVLPRKSTGNVPNRGRCRSTPEDPSLLFPGSGESVGEVQKGRAGLPPHWSGPPRAARRSGPQIGSRDRIPGKDSLGREEQPSFFPARDRIGIEGPFEQAGLENSFERTEGLLLQG